jgi:transcriptional regulator with XRE-family HTH domain
VDIGKFIREERLKRGWTQLSLAKAVGVTKSAVAQWELGQSRPSPQSLIDVCAVFGISAHSFFAPGSPYHGHMVEDPQETELLGVWRAIPRNLRSFALDVLRLLHRHAAGVELKPAQPPRKRADNDAG